MKQLQNYRHNCIKWPLITMALPPSPPSPPPVASLTTPKIVRDISGLSGFIAAKLCVCLNLAYVLV